jgi:hypothetical protein
MAVMQHCSGPVVWPGVRCLTESGGDLVSAAGRRGDWQAGIARLPGAGGGDDEVPGVREGEEGGGGEGDGGGRKTTERYHYTVVLEY